MTQAANEAEEVPGYIAPSSSVTQAANEAEEVAGYIAPSSSVTQAANEAESSSVTQAAVGNRRNDVTCCSQIFSAAKGGRRDGMIYWLLPQQCRQQREQGIVYTGNGFSGCKGD